MCSGQSERTIKFKFHMLLWHYQLLYVLKKKIKAAMDHMMLILLQGFIYLWLLH